MCFLLPYRGLYTAVQWEAMTQTNVTQQLKGQAMEHVSAAGGSTTSNTCPLFQLNINDTTGIDGRKFLSTINKSSIQALC